MRAVMREVPQSILDWRRRTGADKFDEMWEGVLHMIPAPTVEHQEFEGALETWLRSQWAAATGGRVLHNVNVSGGDDWQEDYRVPDLVLILPHHFDIVRATHLHGPPSVVVEIRSPDDETYEKFDFYAALGVPEIWVVHRDTKVPELHELAEGAYRRVAATDAGWLESSAGVEFRSADEGGFEIRLTGDESSSQVLGRRL